MEQYVYGYPTAEYYNHESKVHVARNICSNRTLCGRKFAGRMTETLEQPTCKICLSAMMAEAQKGREG